MKRSTMALALLPLAGLVELAADRAFARRAPAFEDWSAVAAPVGELRKPEDLLVVAPRWGEPLARRALGDAAFPLRDLGRSFTEDYAGAVEISILGQRSEELAGFREVDRREVGRFVIRRLENPEPVRVLFDFTSALAPPTQAFHVRAEGTYPCPWNPRAQVQTGGLGGHPAFARKRFECPGGPFMHVGETVIADQDFLPRRCVFAHPPPSGAELVIRFPSVPAGDRIVGRSGMYWMIERERKGAPVTFEVRIGPEILGTVVHHDGEGFARFEVPLGGRGGDVDFVVRSENAQHRHFCFHAEVR